jgi:hypothetical protein
VHQVFASVLAQELYHDEFGLFVSFLVQHKENIRFSNYLTCDIVRYLNIYIMKMFSILTSTSFRNYCMIFNNKSLFTIPGFDIIYHLCVISSDIKYLCLLGYNEFDFFLENKEYRPFDGCKIEI